eukprot:TRINITY_DN3959_c0_g1_i4.p1 TRINITY_DN3959_c0_g1~~TRINITY_DN3959_c0_g1_i4.p1  ORF type:complete len:1097 (+),score=422.74 TRINITY_DN3959_c0_g1_i4:91-3381(+)
MNFEQACQHVLELLIATTQPNQEVIQNAERALTVCEQQPGYGVILMSILENKAFDLGIRQLAGVMLRQFIEHHWSGDVMDEHFREPVVPDADKAHIRAGLPDILVDPSSKIRTVVGVAIGQIATHDFPDNWPGLLEKLVSYISSNDPIAVQGGIRALVLFAEEIHEAQLPAVIQVLFPVLLRVLAAPEVFPNRVRMRAITVYRSCVASLALIKAEEANRQPANRLLKATLPDWIEAFKMAFADLNVNDMGMGFGVRLEAIKTLKLLIVDFPRLVSKSLPGVMKCIWDNLLAVTPSFITSIINPSDEDENDEVVYDEDGDVVGVEAFLEEVFELFGTIAACPVEGVRGLFETPAVLQETVSMTVTLMQMTDEQIRLWDRDINAYVAAEELDTYSVRTTCKNFLSKLVEFYDNDSVAAISVACQAALQEAHQRQQHGDANWWKLREAAVLAISIVADQLPDVLQDLKRRAKKKKSKQEAVALDIDTFIAEVLIADINPASGNSYLRARALTCLALFSSQLAARFYQPALQGVVAAVQENERMNVRLGGVKALGLLIDTDSLPAEVTTPVLPHIMAPLCQLLTVATEDTLHLTLETLTNALKADAAVSSSVESTVTPLLLQAWSKHANDRLVTECVLGVFEVMASTPATLPSLLQHSMPTLISILQNHQQMLSGTVEVALDMIQMMVQPALWAQLGAEGEAKVPELVEGVLGWVLSVCLASDDHSVLKSGAGTLACLLQLTPQVFIRCQVNGQPSWVLTCQIIAKLLSPESSDDAASSVGSLIIQTILKLGPQLGVDGLINLLNASVQRLEDADALHSIRSLILVFARLFNVQDTNEMLALMNRLSLVKVKPPKAKAGEEQKGEERRPALISLLTKWLPNEADLETLSPYFTKTSVSALCSLLSVSEVMDALQVVTVDGYAVLPQAAAGPKRVTRSSSKPISYSPMPIPAKILSVLLKSYTQASRKKKLAYGSGDEEDDDDDEEDFDDDEGDEGDLDDDEAFDEAALLNLAGGQANRESPFMYADGALLLSDMWDDADAEELGEDDADPLDPVNHVQLDSYIPQFLKKFASTDSARFARYVEFLNEEDRALLQTILQLP